VERADFIERDVQVRGVRLHVLEAGEGPLVVLLHGFPEFSYAWCKQLPALAGAGFRALAPDQRGYAESGKPKHVRDYRVEELAADVAALIESCGREKAVLVGHDWGGIVAYYTAMLHPERVDRLVVINAPHPARYDALVRRRPSQIARSWYAFCFLVPVLPEIVARIAASRWLGRWMQTDARPGSYTDEDIRRYEAAWSRPGALRAGINYYRALFLRKRAAERALRRRIDVPTLILWGDRDRYLIPENAEPDPAWLPQAELVRFPQASHWLQHEEPARVNELIIDFLRR
jgi:pimeloyl-ACP methyl ester carboxylesterase